MATDEEMRSVLMQKAIDGARQEGEPPNFEALEKGIAYTIEGIKQGAYPLTLAAIEETLAEQKAHAKRQH